MLTHWEGKNKNPKSFLFIYGYSIITGPSGGSKTRSYLSLLLFLNKFIDISIGDFLDGLKATHSGDLFIFYFFVGILGDLSSGLTVQKSTIALGGYGRHIFQLTQL